MLAEGLGLGAVSLERDYLTPLRVSQTRNKNTVMICASRRFKESSPRNHLTFLRGIVSCVHVIKTLPRPLNGTSAALGAVAASPKKQDRARRDQSKPWARLDSLKRWKDLRAKDSGGAMAYTCTQNGVALVAKATRPKQAPFVDTFASTTAKSLPVLG